MRLLLDEHISPAVAEALRGRDHDVLAVAETDLRTAPDEAIWERAMGDGRVLVTYDVVDFARLAGIAYADGREHPGVVVVSPRTVPQADIGGLADALDDLLRRSPDLTDTVAFLTRGREPRP